MLFENFSITLSYKEMACILDISEDYSVSQVRKFDITQGGIKILAMLFEKGEWNIIIQDNLHPLIKQDTESFVSEELRVLLVQSIVNYFDCFTDRKILRNRN